MVHLNSALTADSFGELVPFTEAEGTTVLTEASDGLIASEYKKFIIDFTARRAYLAVEDGAIRYRKPDLPSQRSMIRSMNSWRTQ